MCHRVVTGLLACCHRPLLLSLSARFFRILITCIIANSYNRKVAVGSDDDDPCCLKFFQTIPKSCRRNAKLFSARVSACDELADFKIDIGNRCAGSHRHSLGLERRRMNAKEKHLKHGRIQEDFTVPQLPTDKEISFIVVVE